MAGFFINYTVAAIASLMNVSDDFLAELTDLSRGPTSCHLKWVDNIVLY